MKSLISGVQPTGNLHLGNYIGSINNWVVLQGSYRSLFFVADMHAITLPQNPEDLRRAIFETVAIYVASGIDPSKSIIFRQSQISAHTELAWILSCFTQLGLLNRMTQYKEKSTKTKEAANLGLYTYPVLMAADVLLYNVDIVPVGEDQKQHLELARDIAGNFNRQLNVNYFKLPEPYIIKESSRIMSLRDASKKMSKSDESDYSRINLIDDSDLILKKFAKAKTDSIQEIFYQKDTRPDVSNLINIFAVLSNKQVNQIVEEYGHLGAAKFKKDLADLVISKLEPIRLEFIKLKNDQSAIFKMLAENEEKVRAIAEANLNQVKKLVGFL